MRVRVEGERSDIRLEAAASKLPPVLVFNIDYVRDVIAERNGTFDKVASIGEGAAGEQVGLAHEEDRIRRVSRALRAVEYNLKRIGDDKNAVATIVATEARSTLNVLDAVRYDSRRFDRQAFRKKCEELAREGTLPTKLSEEELSTHQTRIAVKLLKQIAATCNIPADDSDLMDRGKELITRSVAASVIPRLAADPDVEAWVARGLQIHTEHAATNCLYCTARLPAGYSDILRGHYNDAYEALVQGLKTLAADLESRVTSLRDFVNQLPEPDRLLPQLAEEFNTAAAELKLRIERRLKALEAMESARLNRAANPLKSGVAPEILVIHSSGSLQALANVFARHNQAASTLDELKQQSERGLLAHYWADDVERCKPLAAKEASLKARRERLRLRQSRAEQRVSELKALLKGQDESARRLTATLADYLGHEQLALAATDEGYQLTRSGNPCEWSSLSEGEKSGIALLYFLHVLEKDHDSGRDRIVVIDDPVCSLDSNSLYSAIGHIVRRVGAARQLFLFTHNLAAHREWRRGLSNATEFRCKIREKQGNRSSVIEGLEGSLKKYNSEYQYLYHCVKQAAEGGLLGYDAVPIANVIRRLAEAFIGFKMPQTTAVGSPKLKEWLDGLNEQATANQALSLAELFALERFLNRNSHNNAIPVPAEEYDSPPAEHARVAAILLKLMSAVDSQHVRGLDQLLTSVSTPSALTTPTNVPDSLPAVQELPHTDTEVVVSSPESPVLVAPPEPRDSKYAVPRSDGR